MGVTHKPMIYDADSGGQTEILCFTMRALEDIGVSACSIEDKSRFEAKQLVWDIAHAELGRHSVVLRQDRRGD